MRLQTVERLSVYRRLVQRMAAEGRSHVFSHQLAHLAHCTPAVVRRDVMDLDYRGVPSRGYAVGELLGAMDRVLDADEPQSAVLVGAGRLGRALLDHFGREHGSLRITAAFDTDSRVTGRLVQGIPCYDMSQLPALMRRERVDVSILAVPGREAQAVADQVVRAGISAIVAFGDEVLSVPGDVLVEQVDFTSALERLAWQLRQGDRRQA